MSTDNTTDRCHTARVFGIDVLDELLDSMLPLIDEDDDSQIGIREIYEVL